MELTYDQLTELEKQIMSLAWKSISGTRLLEQTFIEGLREIMPPTCSKNERAFLDEIREKGEWMNSLKCLVVKKQDQNSPEQTGFLFQSDFTKCNLSELVEGE